MRLIAMLLVAMLTGCANTPYRAEYTKAGVTPSQYQGDRDSCKADAMEFGKQQDATYSDVMLHFVQRRMLACMRDKGYAPIGIHPGAYKQAL